MNLSRRTFFSGLAAALAVPAVISAGSLMPLRGVKLVLPRLRLVSEVAGIDIACPDVVLSGLDGPTPPDLFAAMNKLLVRAPRFDRAYAPDIRFEATDRVRQHMQIQAIRKKAVLLEAAVPTAPPPAMLFRRVPIEIVR